MLKSLCSSIPVRCLLVLLANVALVDAAAVASPLDIDAALDLWHQALHADGDAGTVTLGDKCSVDFKIETTTYAGQLRKLFVVNVIDLKTHDRYQHWFGTTTDHVLEAVTAGSGAAVGFTDRYQVGLDCETQGCISYADAVLELTPTELRIVDQAPYDPIRYATMQTLVCPLN